MGALCGNMAKRARQDNWGKMNLVEIPDALGVDLAVMLVQDEAMMPAYRVGDVVLYCRPGEGIVLQPGDDVLVLLPGLSSQPQLYLRRVARWDADATELYALNGDYPIIREHPRHAVLCGKVVGRLG